MTVPTHSRDSLSLFLVPLLLCVLVLSGCSGGGTPATVTPAAPNAVARVSISPSSVMPGQSATLTWSSSNATSCTASGAWSGSLATAGSSTVQLQGNTAETFTVTCSGAGLPGENSATLSLSAQEGSCAVSNAVRAHSSKRSVRIRKATASGSHS